MPAIFVLILLLMPLAGARAQEPDSINLHHVWLAVEVDPGARYISGRCQLHFSARGAGRDEPLVLQLADDYIISSITSGGKPLYYFRAQEHIKIYPQGQWAGRDSVTVAYRGVPPVSGMGSVMFGRHGAVPVFWTLSEPYGAKDWWPCRQRLDDKIDSLRLTITCPQMYRPAANGVLVSDSVANGRRTAEWWHRYPIAYYLIGMSVTNYKTYTDRLAMPGGDTIEVENYVYPEKYDQWRRRTYKLMPAFKMMCDSFGEYPFAREGYGHAQFGWGGGMEHQTMSFISNPGLDLMIHELAHQWFGNMITCKSWSDVFLNEALATYCELLATEKGVAQSSDPAQWRRVCINKAARKPGETVVRQSLDSPEKIFDTDVVYHKGAMVMHMLRKEIGDFLFFRCLRSYAGNPLLRYGSASAGDFINTCNIISGRSLGWFFGQWLYGCGIPRYNIKWRQQGNGNVSLVVDEETQGNEGKFMRAKIPLLLHGACGEKTLFVLNHTASRQHFTISPKFRVSEIEFDPYCDLLSLGAAVEMKKK